MKWKVGKSEIHGNGVFASEDVKPKEDMGVSIPMIKNTPNSVFFQRNTFGLLINDSQDPNVECVKIGSDWHFVSTKSIKEGQEIVIKYQDYMDKIENESLVERKKVSVL